MGGEDGSASSQRDVGQLAGLAQRLSRSKEHPMVIIPLQAELLHPGAGDVHGCGSVVWCGVVWRALVATCHCTAPQQLLAAVVVVPQLLWSPGSTAATQHNTLHSHAAHTTHCNSLLGIVRIYGKCVY